MTEPSASGEPVSAVGRWTPRRWIGIGALAVIALIVGAASLRSPQRTDYRPDAPPRPLPSTGTLTAVSRPGFDGILIGQQPKPVVVNVWASWCAPCRTEMPLLSRAAKTYRGRVTVLGVASRDDPGAAQAFLDDLDVAYPNVFDVDGTIRVGLGVSAYPTTYIFRSDGTLQSTVSGGISEQRLAALIDEALR